MQRYPLQQQHLQQQQQQQLLLLLLLVVLMRLHEAKHRERPERRDDEQDKWRHR